MTVLVPCTPLHHPFSVSRILAQSMEGRHSWANRPGTHKDRLAGATPAGQSLIATWPLHVNIQFRRSELSVNDTLHMISILSPVGPNSTCVSMAWKVAQELSKQLENLHVCTFVGVTVHQLAAEVSSVHTGCHWLQDYCTIGRKKTPGCHS